LPWWRYGGTLNTWSQLLGTGAGAFGICLVGLAVLFVAYLWGWRLVRAGRADRRIVWGFAVLFAATLFWLMPITSDLFTYVSQAHLFTDLGVSPLVVAPLDMIGDRLILAYPALYATNPSVYGPAWTLISAPGTLGPHDVVGGLFYLKGLALIAYLGSVWLVEQICRQIRPAAALDVLYRFAWNPLVLLMAMGDGHNDMAMMAVVLLAFWLLLQERWVLAFGALALSVWIKYVSMVFAPLFVIYVLRARSAGEGEPARARYSALVGGALAAMGVSLLAFVPFWNEDLLSGLVVRLARPVNWQSEATGLSSWILGLGLLLFVVAYAVLAWQFLREPGSLQRLLNVSFTVSLLAFVLGAARSQPWHLIWPVALAGLSDRRWAWPVVIGLSVLLLAGQVWVEWGAPGVQILY
jgi:hypothetical protein